MERKVKIIMLTWNGLEYTKKCLESLRDNTDYSDYEMVIVDNGSSDGTVEYLETLDWIKLIKNSSNEGFVRGNNIALKEVMDEDVILLNNDMIITQSDWINKMSDLAYEDEKTGLVGCRLVNEKGEFLHAGTVIYPETYWGQQIGGGGKDVGQYKVNREVEGVVFACVYIKNEIIKTVGVLDERYFSYFEDTDYCFRVREKGYKCMYCGEVTLIHYQNVSTDINKANFSDMFKKSQKTFRGIWNNALVSRYEGSLAWHSIVNFPSGYAVSSKNIMESLDRKNIDVRYKYVYGKGTVFPVEEAEHSDSYTINIIRHRDFDTSITQVVYGQGDVFYKNSGKYKIGYTMLEVTGIPKEWVKQANAMDEVWVPSSFNVETFRNSGVKAPIHIVPLGVDVNFFNPKIDNYKKHNKYTFLSVFEWGERKAPEILLRSYAKAFNKRDDVLLICKIINNDGTINVEKEINKLGLPKDMAEVIVLSNYIIPDYQMPTLYRSADCFVLPTRGEGWGMPVLEAMGCGLPVIATAWSSQMDFMTKDNAYLLNIKGLSKAEAKCPYYDGFSWADPDKDHLVELLRYVYNNQDEGKAKGLYASKEVAQKWTWDNTAEVIIDRLKNCNR